MLRCTYHKAEYGRLPCLESSFSKHSVYRIAIVSGGRASVPRAITAGRLLYAKETKALGGSADIWLCDGEGKLGLAWLAGRSPYRGHLRLSRAKLQQD